MRICKHIHVFVDDGSMTGVAFPLLKKNWGFTPSFVLLNEGIFFVPANH